MDVIRCKMTLDEQSNDGEKTSKFVFGAVYHGDDPEHENFKFWAATPAGQLILQCVNEAVMKQLEVNKEYYIDIIDVEEYNEKIKRMTAQSTK